MKPLTAYLLAVLLHLAILFGWVVSANRPPIAEEKQYVEVTLKEAPKPETDVPSLQRNRGDDIPAGLADNNNPPAGDFAPALPVKPAPIVAAMTKDPLTVTPLPEATAIPAPMGKIVQWSSGALGSGPGNRRGGGNGHYYEVVYAPDGVNWYDAEDYAHHLGGYLATINSAAENEFVFSLIADDRYWFWAPSEFNSGPWLGGLNDSAGVWRWVDADERMTFTSWNTGEPNNLRDNESRLQYSTGKSRKMAPVWNDLDGNRLNLAFVIEYDENHVRKVPEKVKTAAASAATP